MAKSLSITVHPSPVMGERLTVSDALRQVLDMVAALESLESDSTAERQIVWRLVEAHTNSPPFTLVAQAYPRDPQVSVAIQADRVTRLYASAVRTLVIGERVDWLAGAASKRLESAFRRNLNGVGLTDIVLGDQDRITINPSAAQIALIALSKEPKKESEELQRSEYGSAEGQIVGLTRYYSSPAIVLQERLSGERIVCALSENLAQEIGPEHAWSEAWEGQWIRLSGQLYYGSDGKLKRLAASNYEKIVWADIPVKDLKELDILQGRTLQEHISLFWGDEVA